MVKNKPNSFKMQLRKRQKKMQCHPKWLTVRRGITSVSVKQGGKWKCNHLALCLPSFRFVIGRALWRDVMRVTRP